MAAGGWNYWRHGNVEIKTSTICLASYPAQLPVEVTVDGVVVFPLKTLSEPKIADLFRQYGLAVPPQFDYVMIDGMWRNRQDIPPQPPIQAELCKVVDLYTGEVVRSYVRTAPQDVDVDDI